MFHLEHGDGACAVAAFRSLVLRGGSFQLIVLAFVAGFIWLAGSHNPYTPAGYVGSHQRRSLRQEPRTYVRDEVQQIEIERKERTKRELQVAGIANAMQMSRGQLGPLYAQHEAIEAQRLMVNSPNHTTEYIPVGPMGVPLTGTFPANPAGTPRAGQQR